MDPQEIKEQLKRTWLPFFSRFGSFTQIQVLTIPHILNFENVVVISPAATGKTEAVVAPMLENLIKKGKFKTGHNGLKVLYISPTRALVNDLHRRLVDPISYLNINLGIKTGDRPRIIPQRMPQILLTTPESFDSLLTRHTKIFLNLEAVILDEIHLLDNTPRGDQLRILLNRLRKINDRLQYCALSATIDDLNIGERYFPEPKVCFLKAPREIEYLLLPNKEFIDYLFQIAKERSLKKILIFFNARSLAELFSQKLNRPLFQDMILVHHASLPKKRREEVEKLMNNSERAILCATSTLELGIDIGDFDCIVLYRPPYNVSSLLQRIGRGNRQVDKLFAVGIYTNHWEKILFETYFECAQQGQLFEKRYNPTLSVIPQQMYSYLYQRRRIGTTLNNLYNIFDPVYDDEQIKRIFKKLIDDTKITEFRPGIYYDSNRLETKIDWGKIHSNIAEISFGEYDVFDATTGGLIGRIFYLREKFILGGKCWQIVQILEKEKKVYARYIGEASAFTKIFEGKGAGSYNYLLAPIIMKKISSENDLMEFPYAWDGKNTHILHLLGSLYSFILAEALYEERVDVMDVDGKMLVLSEFQLVDEVFPIPKKDSVRCVIVNNISRFEDALGSGAYFYDLPVEYQIEDHYLNLDIEGFLEYLSAIKLVYKNMREFQELLESLK